MKGKVNYHLMIQSRKDGDPGTCRSVASTLIDWATASSCYVQKSGFLEKAKILEKDRTIDCCHFVTLVYKGI